MATQFPYLPAIDDIVHLRGDQPTTHTLIIAEQFGMQHKNVLAAVRGLECSAEFNRLNFQPVKYRDAKGQYRQAFEVTRDGFMFLAMGFTGSKAAQLKERFICAFNHLERRVLVDHQRQVAQLRHLALSGNPLWHDLARYQEMGLTLAEIGKLVGKSAEAVRHHLRRLADAGLIDYRPDPKRRVAGLKGQRVRQENQLALGLGGEQ